MYKLPKELRDSLIEYFLSRPMREVEGAVQMLRGLELIETDSEDAEKVT